MVFIICNTIFFLYIQNFVKNLHKTIWIQELKIQETTLAVLHIHQQWVRILTVTHLNRVYHGHVMKIKLSLRRSKRKTTKSRPSTTFLNFWRTELLCRLSKGSKLWWVCCKKWPQGPINESIWFSYCFVILLYIVVYLKHKLILYIHTWNADFLSFIYFFIIIKRNFAWVSLRLYTIIFIYIQKTVFVKIFTKVRLKKWTIKHNKISVCLHFLMHLQFMKLD